MSNEISRYPLVCFSSCFYFSIFHWFALDLWFLFGVTALTCPYLNLSISAVLHLMAVKSKPGIRYAINRTIGQPADNALCGVHSIHLPFILCHHLNPSDPVVSTFLISQQTFFFINLAFVIIYLLFYCDCLLYFF